jgi:hypothetical protein
MCWMHPITRALLLSVIASGLLAWMLYRSRRSASARQAVAVVNADRLPPALQQHLLDELDRLL